MSKIISVQNLTKKYANEFIAIKNLSLDIYEGEIIALLGPNGAGKTTLISTICGLSSITSGSIKVKGLDVIEDYRKTREIIGLVPQELSLEPFEKVINSIKFSRRLFGKKNDDDFIDDLLKKLHLFDKKNEIIKSLSGGMKRRVLIAKALSHNPKILFLDEPTAGVDVELRKDMWALVNSLRASGVTVILTTHYIDEAEAIADRVGVMNHGKMLLLSDKKTLLKKMGKKELKIELHDPITAIPESLSVYKLSLSEQRTALLYSYDTSANRTGITKLLTDISKAGLILKDVSTRQSSLEDIFTNLLEEKK